MKLLLGKIQENQLSTFIKLNEFFNQKPLPTKHRGLYWLWTNLDNETLKQAIPLAQTKEVPIDKLVTQRENLKCVANITNNNFKIVYNGIGGYLKEKPSFGLRERINQEVTCNDYRTGTLNLSRRFNLDNWAVSYFDFDDEMNKVVLERLNTNQPYKDFAKDLENLWRLEFGTPILCRH